jgi:hypothetical protein
MSGIVEIVIDTPCYGCQRLARYTVYHRANDDLLERLRKPISHRDVHDICAMLEEKHEQVVVGVCECGAAGQETTSVEFRDQAIRKDLNYISGDLGYENVRLSLDGQTLWESDIEIWRKGLGDILRTPDPTPDEALAHSDQRMAEMDAIQARLHAAFMALDDPPGAEYIRSKARLYCRIGAMKYRASDALRQPDATLPLEKLAAIDWGMAQFADGLGFSAATPLTVPAEYSHSLAAAVHFEVFAQMARRSTDGRSFLDALLCRHVIDGREVTIFNRVPTGQKDEPS